MKFLLKNNIEMRSQSIQFFCYLIILFSTIQYSFGFESQENDSTIVNFQNVDFKNNTEIVLDSGWAFYWDELIYPTDFNKEKPFKEISIKDWTQFDLANNTKLPSFGFATYKLSISLPKKRPHISLFIPAAYSASKIWVNGELISEIGTVGRSKESTLHRRFSKTIPLHTDITNFEIVIHVANFYHTKGGMVESPIVAPSDYLQSESNRLIISDMIFIGSISFIGIFFLLFFLFYWNKDKAVLYFAILCISWAYRALNDAYAPFTLIFPSANWTFLTRIEYITLFLGGAAACLFFATIFSNYIHKIYAKIIVYSFLLSFLLVVFLPSQYFTKLLVPFIYYMILCLVYMVFIMVKAIIDKRYESILALVSIVFGLVVFCLHIFVFLDGNGKDLVYINLGYVLVFLLVSMLLMMRFSKSFKDLEISKQIALKQKKEISSKSYQLSKTNLELKDNLKLLENHNSELDDFAHIVSHDLKSPLVAVNALVHFIEEDIKVDLDKTTKSHFELLKERISKMDGLINALLEYSKIAKGNKRKEFFNLNELLKELVNVIDSEKKHIILLPEGDAQIFANKTEMKHVFQNLMENAIRHSDKKSTLIKISFLRDKNNYQFSIQDDGSGINPKYHKKIFDMFTKINPDTKVASTGIGLSIVKKIISENHGKISIESEEGFGTKVNFSLKISTDI